MTRTKHLYKRFFSLFIGQAFFIRRGKIAAKVSPFAYREPGKGGPAKVIAPWRKVRTLIPITTTGRFNTRENVQNVNKYWPRAKDCLGPQETAVTGCVGDYSREHFVAMRACEQRARIDEILAEANSGKTHYVGDSCPGGHQRDPMDQDHAPEKSSEVDRNGPAS